MAEITNLRARALAEGDVAARRIPWSTAFISLNGTDQSPGDFCRNSRMLEYHGLSLRPRIQRQSITAGNATQTGTPSAPAF